MNKKQLQTFFPLTAVKLFCLSTLLLVLSGASVRADTQTWSAPTLLTAYRTMHPSVALSSNGTVAIAAWFNLDSVLQVSCASITGGVATWSEPVDLYKGRRTFSPQVALSSDGTRATIVWETGTFVRSVSGTISGNSPEWGRVSTLSRGSVAHLAMSSDGTRATAIWMNKPTNTNWVIQTASARIEGNSARWGKVTTLTHGRLSGWDPKVALSSDGTKATAVWQFFNQLNTAKTNVQSASATIAGNAAKWGKVTDVSRKGELHSDPDVKLSSDGTKATVIWTRPQKSPQSASAIVSGRSARWGEPLNISDQSSHEARIALSLDGSRATAIWTGRIGMNQVIQSASAAISGNTVVWGPTTSVQDGDRPRVALSTDGSKAVVVWQASNRIRTAVAAIDDTVATFGPPSDFILIGYPDMPLIAASADGENALAVWSTTVEGAVAVTMKTESGS